MGKTAKPTGLSITRNGNKYTITWKIASKDHGDGQRLQYKTRRYDGKWREDWNSVTVNATATSKVITLSTDDYYPNEDPHLTGIKFRVKGKRADHTGESGTVYTYDWSDWVYKTMDIETPNKPSLTATLQSQSNVTAFAWNIETSSENAKVFTDYEYEAIRIPNCTETSGSKIDWDSSATTYRTGTGTATSGSISITEDTAVISSESHTRWFRMRSRGPAGDSAWVYAKHVYATPWIARISKATATAKSGKTLIEVKWEAQTNAAHPIDETTVEYCVGTPTANMNLPASPSWTVADTSKDTKGNDKAAFYYDSTLGDDQCIWVRVKTKHDSRENYSSVKLVAVGTLPNPSNLSVSVSGSTATITCTNNSSSAPYTGSDTSVIRQFLALTYRGAKQNQKGYCIGIIPSGSTSVAVTLPNQTGETAYTIGARAVVGTYTGQRTIKKEVMTSDTIWTTASVPKPPTGVALEYDGDKLSVNWAWSWDDATSAELSWSDDPNAWTSTTEPQSYTINNRVTSWDIGGLEAGRRYYVRVRLISTDNNDSVVGPWSDRKSLYLTVPPAKPTLKLSSGQVTRDGKVTASWNYVSGDGTEQSYAEVRIVTGTNTYSQAIGHTESAKHITLYPSDLGWARGSSYKLVLRVKSASGSFSEYSDPVTVEVAKLCQASITSDSLTNVTIQDDTGVTRTVTALTVMPMTVTVAGAGRKGTTEVSIERAEDYVLERPDESISNGFKGETIYTNTFTGEGTVTIRNSNISGFFDDGAKYRLIVTVSDDLGQSTSVTKNFEVHWQHQAIVPTGTATIDGIISKIRPTAPTGTASGDTCDIYRLSVDKPVLIYPNAAFGSTYVDPYPAIGEHGGHRLVFKTANGDYITASNQLAWLDIYDNLDIDRSIIDFADDQVLLEYNMELSSAWKKDFKMTKYLGGSIQGDWDPGIERSSTIKAVGLVYRDPEMIQAMRRLAEYTGICHVRTVDGSSYAADVQVSETTGYNVAGKIATFDVSITRIDPEEYDGVTLSAWED